VHGAAAPLKTCGRGRFFRGEWKPTLQSKSAFVAGRLGGTRGGSQCQRNLHNAALAMLNYEFANESLPKGVQFDSLDAQNATMNAITKLVPIGSSSSCRIWKSRRRARRSIQRR
jgi:hypothetical protein